MLITSSVFAFVLGHLDLQSYFQCVLMHLKMGSYAFEFLRECQDSKISYEESLRLKMIVESQ